MASMRKRKEEPARLTGSQLHLLDFPSHPRNVAHIYTLQFHPLLDVFQHERLLVLPSPTEALRWPDTPL